MFLSLALATVGGAALALAQAAAAANSSNHVPSYSPARPPAVPLAVRSPYTSAWSSTAGNATLNSADVIFWTGSTLGWEGMVTVDGVTYEYMGVGSQTLPSMPTLQTAIPESVSYDSQYSNFTFLAGPVRVTASFFSPVTPKDICRTSMPLSYLTISVDSLDGAAHHVQFYADVNGAWIAEENSATIEWDLRRGTQAINGTGNATNSASSLYSWVVYLQTPYTFGEESDFPQWGNFTWTTSPQGAANFSFQSGYGINVRYQYVTGAKHVLADVVDSDYRGWGVNEPVFAYAHDAGTVRHAQVRYTVGTVQTPVIRYLYAGGVASLAPWWEKCYGDMYSMIAFHWNDFATVQQLGNEFEAQLQADVDSYYEGSADPPVYSNASSPGAEPFYSNGSQGWTYGVDQYGEQYVFDPNTAYGFLDAANFTGVGVPGASEAEAYYSIVALSARQVMHAYVYAIPPPAYCADGGTSSTTPNATSSSAAGTYSDPLMFQKEISSDGNVNTVDVLYPATPFFLWANPEMLRYTLQPLYENQEGAFYPNGYSMHDLGSNFPNATGHVEGNDEYMPVEESGNFILMSYAYYKFSGNTAWLSEHYALLHQFATYLIQFSLIPAAQLSTDDFAGTLTNQTNLAIKGIVGLQAMGAIARLTGHAADAANFSATASEYYSQWEYFAIEPEEPQHTVLAYQWRSSWGLLYNIFPDKLLDLDIISPDVYAMQSQFYPTVSQVFGVPLDNRHHYTKSDWMMWTAATCEPTARRLFVTSLAYWLNNTDTAYPFTDLYETVDSGAYPTVPDVITFKARPVAGGHFSLLALLRSGQTQANAAGNMTGSVFGANSTNAVISEAQLPTPASSDLGPSGSGSATQMPYSLLTLTSVNASGMWTSVLTSYTETPTVSSVGMSTALA